MEDRLWDWKFAMNSTLSPYLAYKPSGVPWLGDVPEHWEVIPNRALMNPKKDVVGARADDFTLLSLTRRGVIPRDVDNAFGKFPSSFDTYQVIEPGDLVFCLFDIDETPRTVGRSRLRGIVTGAYARFVCADVDTREFLYLLYLSLDDGKLLRPLYSGLRKVIPVTTFLRAKVALPPKSEQRAIVRYLDHVDWRIRRYVKAKRKLIGLLEQEKQVVVNQAVTRGLNPNVRLKPSGVEWLGDVPEHWETMRARFLFKEVDTRSTSGKETHLSMSQTLGLVPSHLVEQSLISDSYVGGKLCQEGDLVLNRLKAHLGVFALAKQVGVISPDYSVFRRRGSVKMEYFFRVLRLPALRTELRIRAKGIVEGFWRLYTDDFFNIRLPVPPYFEQQAIVEFVDRATTDVDAAITRARHQIELVEEYRTRLIADVVTGNLDVREAAAQLPDEAGPSGSGRGRQPDGGRPGRRNLRCRGRTGNRREGENMIDWSKCPGVEQIPGKVSGAWLFTDSRLPISALFENLEAGATVEEFMEWFAPRG